VCEEGLCPCVWAVGNARDVVQCCIIVADELPREVRTCLIATATSNAEEGVTRVRRYCISKSTASRVSFITISLKELRLVEGNVLCLSRYNLAGGIKLLGDEVCVGAGTVSMADRPEE